MSLQRWPLKRLRRIRETLLGGPSVWQVGFWILDEDEYLEPFIKMSTQHHWVTMSEGKKWTSPGSRVRSTGLKNLKWVLPLPNQEIRPHNTFLTILNPVGSRNEAVSLYLFISGPPLPSQHATKGFKNQPEAGVRVAQVRGTERGDRQFTLEVGGNNFLRWWQMSKYLSGTSSSIRKY